MNKKEMLKQIAAANRYEGHPYYVEKAYDLLKDKILKDEPTDEQLMVLAIAFDAEYERLKYPRDAIDI